MSEAGSEEHKSTEDLLSDSDIMSDTEFKDQPLAANYEQGPRPKGAAAKKGRSADVIQITARHSTSSSQSPSPQAIVGPVTFNQTELRLIFGVYGRKVAAGEWRDYALDFFRDQAIFSIFRRSSEVPLYRIEKTPRLARKQGEYAAVAASGLILKRGSDLERVLAVLDKPLKIVR